MIFMNTTSLVRNALVALSLGAFLISPAHATQPAGNQEFERPTSSARIPAGRVARLINMFENNSLASVHAAQSDAANNTTQAPTIARIQQGDRTITAVLPQETLQKIFNYLPLEDAGHAREACVAFCSALSGPEYVRSSQSAQFLRHLQTSRQASSLVDTMLSGPLLLGE